MSTETWGMLKHVAAQVLKRQGAECKKHDTYAAVVVLDNAK
jgi:hypothetical protein